MKNLKTLIFLLLALLFVGSSVLAMPSLGLISAVAKTESLSNTPLSGFVGIDVIGLDLRWNLGPLFAGLATPFMMFTLSEDTGLGCNTILPGIAWYGYVGAKVGFDLIYIRGDIGHTLALGPQQLGFSPVRLGVGFEAGRLYFEFNIVGILQNLKETLGKVYNLQLGWRF